jgi:hypothetical protein
VAGALATRRPATLTPERRKEIARDAIAARWNKTKKKAGPRKKAAAPAQAANNPTEERK